MPSSRLGRAADLAMADLLNASRVTKRFGGLIAVSSVDFTIPEKSIVSLIGPNGAGKTRSSTSSPHLRPDRR